MLYPSESISYLFAGIDLPSLVALVEGDGTGFPELAHSLLESLLGIPICKKTSIADGVLLADDEGCQQSIAI